MARKLRELVEGGLYHVYARGNDGRLIFLYDEDRFRYLELLGEVVLKKDWFCLQYCLMDNHVHLLLETPQANLDSGVQLLHGKYGRWFNDRYERSGHLFQGRYGSNRIESDAQLWATVGYIAANPVAAGLCASCHEWPWSSHGPITSEQPSSWLAVPRLFEHLCAFGPDPRSTYARVTDQAVALLATAA